MQHRRRNGHPGHVERNNGYHDGRPVRPNSLLLYFDKQLTHFSTRHLPHEFYGPVPTTIAHAAIRNNIVAMVLHSDSQFHLKTLFVHGINTTNGILCGVKGDVTCIALVKLGDTMAMVAGVWRDERPILLISPVTGEDIGEPIELDSFRGKSV